MEKCFHSGLYLASNDCPVMSFGMGRPITSKTVGATSHRAALWVISLNLSPPVITRGTDKGEKGPYQYCVIYEFCDVNYRVDVKCYTTINNQWNVFVTSYNHLHKVIEWNCVTVNLISLLPWKNYHGIFLGTSLPQVLTLSPKILAVIFYYRCKC